MPTTETHASQQVDAYIASRQPFARPILDHLRALVAHHCPDAEEALKWGMPSFLYKNKILATMAAFKAHASFGFWHGEMVTGGSDAARTAMGSFGRLTSLADLPDDAVLGDMITTAQRLIDEGVRPPHVEGRGKHPKPEMVMCPAFAAALRQSHAAQAVFDAFPPSQQREYLDWIISAKQDATRDRRIAQAIEWLAEGKRRNWKYENC